MILKELNTLSAEEASSWFEQCCAAKTWVYQMVKARPYSDKNALVNQAKSAWAKCSDDDYLEAFTAHPMIGDVDSLRKKFANTKAIAADRAVG